MQRVVVVGIGDVVRGGVMRGRWIMIIVLSSAVMRRESWRHIGHRRQMVHHAGVLGLFSRQRWLVALRLAQHGRRAATTFTSPASARLCKGGRVIQGNGDGSLQRVSTIKLRLRRLAGSCV